MKKGLFIAIVLTMFFLSGLAAAKPILEKIPVDTSQFHTKFNAYGQRDVSFSKNGYPFLEYFWNGAWIDYKMANFFLKNIGSDGNCELTISGTKNTQAFSVKANTSYVLRIKPWNLDYYSDSLVTSTNDKLVFKSAEVSQTASNYEIVLEELPKEADIDLSNLPDKEWFYDTIWERRERYCAKIDNYIKLRNDGLFGYNYSQPDKFKFDGNEKWEVKDGFLYLSWNGGFAIYKLRLTTKDTDCLFGTRTKTNEPYTFHRIKR